MSHSPTYLAAHFRSTIAERTAANRRRSWDKSFPAPKPIRRIVRKSIVGERCDVTLPALAWMDPKRSSP